LKDPNVLGVGYFGSYAKGNWGVGSDLDLVIILRGCEKPFEKRTMDFDFSMIPVPVDAFVYTLEEWKRVEDRFENTIWLKRRFQDGEEGTREG